MSHLRLYSPEESPAVTGALCDEEPAVIPFPSIMRCYALPATSDAALRARTIRRNRCCPHCGHAGVVPLRTDDLLRNRVALAVPGRGLLVGFRCQECAAEWPVFEAN